MAKKKGFWEWFCGLFRKKQKKSSSKKSTKKKGKVAQDKPKKKQVQNTVKKSKGNKVPKSKRRKNVSQIIPNGRTVQTRDEYFEEAGDYRKPGYEDKGLYRSAVVVDSNKKDELALIVLTTKGEDIPGKEKSKFRPFVETKDDEGEPIKIGKKFKENKPKKDLSPKAVAKIKKLTFKDAGNAEENRTKTRDLKGRK